MNKRMSNKIRITIFCKNAFKFATYENVFMFLCLYKYAALYVSWGMYV